MRYVIYVRKSTDSEDRQVQSLADQTAYLERLAKERGLDVVKVFSESQSAKVPGRKIFNEMIAYIQNAHASGILTWKIDRLTRNPKDSGDLQWLSQSGVIQEIITSDRTYLPDDNAIMLALESSMANQYIRDLSKNIKRGVVSKLEKGIWPNYAPIGYKNKDNGIVVDQKTAPYVRRAFTLYATGTKNSKEITNNLFDEGFRSKSGKRYCKSKVHKMLSNTFYYGVMLMQDKYYAGSHTPLITKELFDRVQDMRTGKHHSKRQKHFFPYRGIMNCNVCGCMLTATTKKGHTYYYCTNGKGTCTQHKKYLREEKIEKAFGKSLSCLSFDKALLGILYKAKEEKNGVKESYHVNTLTSLSDQLKLVSTKQERLLEGYCSGIIANDVYEAKDGLLKKEEVDLTVQIKKSKSKRDKEVATLEQQKKVFLTACTIQKQFLEAKSEEKQKH